jgi:branched-subunit amino acid aminotransferase/4-amino-4-deoxychorismate lyase
MHKQIIYNNRLMDNTKVRLSLTSAALYGHGIFTTVAIYNGRPFLWNQHWNRLLDHAYRLNINLNDIDEKTVSDKLQRLIKVNKVKKGRARITLMARSGKGPWQTGLDQQRQTDLLIFTGNNKENHADQELTLTISPYRINTHSPLTGIKSLNYLDHILSWEEAQARNFNQAVRLNEKGEIASATLANIFWIKDGTLHTPSLSAGCLNGVTRSCLLDLAHNMSVPVIEGIHEIAHLVDADEIILTSSGLGVGIVTTFDFRRYTVAVGSVALRLKEAFRQLTLATE